MKYNIFKITGPLSDYVYKDSFANHEFEEEPITIDLIKVLENYTKTELGNNISYKVWKFCEHPEKIVYSIIIKDSIKNDSHRASITLKKNTTVFGSVKKYFHNR